MPSNGKLLEGFNYRTEERPATPDDILNKYAAQYEREMVVLDTTMSDTNSTSSEETKEIEDQKELDIPMKEAIDLLSPEGNIDDGIKEED